MPQFRYRTRALIGPWRSSRDEALLDAVGAKQVLLEGRAPLAIRWLVPGEIEEQADPEEHNASHTASA